jgi:uncharacterized protein (DUF362 family)/Pyruvate/2-oxoacid:ferredoxin oxidoreductase delta subunit
MKSKVALVRCSAYDEESVAAAVARGLELLGGAQAIVKPSEKIVLKPNVLMGRAPEKLIGPHPAVFKAVARQVQAITSRVTYGDGPSTGKPIGHMKRAGYDEMARELRIPLGDFVAGREVHFPDSPFLKHFTLANAVLEADGLVSICKFKTHQLTRITGAIKNQFGCIPGLMKPEYHLRFPNPLDFARMLVCLNLYIRPRLYIMDGIMAMQGNGPASGDPIAMNVLLFSADPIALDATMCRMIDLNPEFAPTNKFGQEWGLGTYRAEEIELLGDPLTSFVNKRFKVVRAPVRPVTSSSVVPFFRNIISPRPVIDPALCQLCGTCVKHCPANPKAVDWHDGDKTRPPTYKYGRCIRCFCCQELCTEAAITVKTPLLGKIFQ